MLEMLPVRLREIKVIRVKFHESEMRSIEFQKSRIISIDFTRAKLSLANFTSSESYLFNRISFLPYSSLSGGCFYQNPATSDTIYKILLVGFIILTDLS